MRCGLRLSVNKAAYSLSWLSLSAFWVDLESGTLCLPSFWLPVLGTGQNLGPPGMYTVSKDTLRHRTLRDISRYADSYLLIRKTWLSFFCLLSLLPGRRRTFLFFFFLPNPHKIVSNAENLKWQSFISMYHHGKYFL